MFDPISKYQHHESEPESEQTQETWSEYQLPEYSSENEESDAEPVTIGNPEQSSRSFLIFWAQPSPSSYSVSSSIYRSPVS